MKFLPLVLKNLLRKKTRSVLTLVSIVLPLFVICILGTLLSTLESDPTGGKGMYRLIVRHRVSLANFISESYKEKIAQLPGVKEICVYNWFGGMYVDQSAKNQFARFGVEPEPFLRIFDEGKIVRGSAADWFADRSGLLVGELLMKKYGWKLGQKVTFKGDIYPTTLELTIRAVYSSPADESSVFFDWKAVTEAVPWAKGTVGTFWIKTDSPESVSRLTREIDAMFENSERPTKTESEKEFQNGFVSMLGNVKLMVTSIGFVIVFVIVLIAANTMAMAARERVTEIAVLRTLGFQKSTVLGLVLAESFVLALAGGLVGLGLFVLAFPGFRQGLLMSPMAGFAAGMRVFPEILAVGFAVALFVGLVAGVVPAVRSAQRSIPDGLRQVA